MFYIKYMEYKKEYIHNKWQRWGIYDMIYYDGLWFIIWFIMMDYVFIIWFIIIKHNKSYTKSLYILLCCIIFYDLLYDFFMIHYMIYWFIMMII